MELNSAVQHDQTSDQVIAGHVDLPEPGGNVLSIMKAEHELIKLLMLELESEHRPSVRKDIFARLNVKLRCHMHAKEQVIFMHLRHNSPKIFDFEPFAQEHSAIVEALDALEPLAGGEKVWGRLMGELVDWVEGHIIGTEDALFEEASSVLSLHEREVLAAQYRWETYRRYRELRGVAAKPVRRVKQYR